MITVGPKTESGDKNSYQFLFKLLIHHFPEQTWDPTYRQMKAENPSGKNIHWKQIFYRVAREGLSKSPDSKEWRTLLKLLEIVRDPNQFLTKNDGKQVIRWKNDTGGRSAFLKKCENMIHHHILSLLRSCIENSHLSVDKKIIFEETLKESHSAFDNGYFGSKKEEDHPNPNFYMEDNMEFHEKVSKKFKTGTADYTWDSQAKIDGVEEEIFQDTEETVTNLVGKVGNLSQNQMKSSHEEEKINSNTGFSQAEYYNVFANEYNSPIMLQDEKDKLIEDLKRQLEEKNRIINEQNQKISALQERESKNNLEGFRNLTIEEEELTQYHIFKLNSTGSNN